MHSKTAVFTFQNVRAAPVSATADTRVRVCRVPSPVCPPYAGGGGADLPWLCIYMHHAVNVLGGGGTSRAVCGPEGARKRFAATTEVPGATML